LTTENEENITLRPLLETIRKLNKRKKIVAALMFLSMPSSLFALVLFGVIAWGSGIASSVVLIFGFLAFSAGVSLAAILYIPDAFSATINNLEATARSISFSITPPIGNTPEQRIINQLKRTDYRIKKVLQTNTGSLILNAKVIGKSGKEYSFDAFIQNVNTAAYLVSLYMDMQVFVKRYDEVNPVNRPEIENVKEAIQDILAKMKRKIPTRVLIVSTSGFNDDAFEYVRSDEGIFNARFSGTICEIELIKEKVDGGFDIQSF
jgi:hypothetical protein